MKLPATDLQMTALRMRVERTSYGRIADVLGVCESRARRLASKAVWWLKLNPDHPEHWMVEAERAILMIRKPKEE